MVPWEVVGDGCQKVLSDGFWAGLSRGVSVFTATNLFCSRSIRITEASCTFLLSSHSDRTPFSQRPHCQRRPSILRYACIFGQASEQALVICNRAPPSTCQVALLLRSGLGTKLLACILQGQKHLDMRSLRLQTDQMVFFRWP